MDVTIVRFLLYIMLFSAKLSCEFHNLFETSNKQWCDFHVGYKKVFADSVTFPNS